MIYMRTSLLLLCFQFFKSWESKEIPVQQEQGRTSVFEYLQWPGGCPEKMEYEIITSRIKNKVTDHRGDTKHVGAEHEPYDDSIYILSVP